MNIAADIVIEALQYFTFEPRFYVMTVHALIEGQYFYIVSIGRNLIKAYKIKECSITEAIVKSSLICCTDWLKPRLHTLWIVSNVLNCATIHRIKIYPLTVGAVREVKWI